jgi:hypothetical protein
MATESGSPAFNDREPTFPEKRLNLRRYLGCHLDQMVPELCIVRA